MRKILFGILVLAAVFLSAVFSSAYASSNPSFYNWDTTIQYNTPTKVLGESTTSSPANFVQFNTYIFGADLTPNNPLYFVKPLQENMSLAFTFDPIKKEEIRIAISGERLDELKKLADANQTNGTATAAHSYEDMMKKAASELEALKAAKKDITSVSKKLEEEAAKQNIILEQISVKVPEKVTADVDKALAANWDGTDTVADLNGRPALPPDMVDRIQAFKAQGLLTAEEATKLVGAKTRSEARQEIHKYVKEGVIPASDFLRMNENVKALYPNEFYKLHEVERFLELQKLESEKPEQLTLDKIQDFSKTYKPGDVVPTDIRRYWVPVVRLEELQNTLRPDLIDPGLLKNRQKDYKKFNEVVERFKPRPEDVAYVQAYLQKNNAQVSDLPPEYQRMYNLAKSYGAQCGSGQNWVPESSAPSGGYCASSSQNTTGTNFSDFFKNKSCNGPVISAKGSGGACSAFARDCIPNGWTIVNTCVETPGGTTTVGSQTTKTITCPSNAHFVPVSYDPSGGYCIPNYTPTSSGQGASETGQTETACQSGYRRYYPSGPCLPEGGSNYYTRGNLPQITTTPGGPFYSNTGRCGQGNHWVPEPINPNGGYCAPDNYNPSNYGSGQNNPSPGNGLPKTDMGNCRTPGECYDYCKAHPTEGDCKNLNPNTPRPGDTVSRESQEAACRAGGGTCVSWVNGACGCERGSGSGGGSHEAQEAACRAGGGTCVSWVNGACSCIHGGGSSCTLTCSSGLYLDSSSCTCRSSRDYPTSCSMPSGGCPSGWSWNQGYCSCISSGSSTSSSPPPSSPPSGYGTCGSGQYWNGSACMSSSSSEDPATACTRGGGCTWTGSSCNCPSTTSTSPPPSSSPPSSPPPSSPPPSSPPPSSPPPSSPPPSSPPPSSPPPSSTDMASQCSSHGGSWNGTSCQCPSTGCH